MPAVSEVFVRIKGDATNLNSSLKGAEGNVRHFGAVGESILQGFGLSIGQLSFEAISSGLKELAGEFIHSNSAAEIWTSQMTLLTHSVGKADERIRQLAAFSLNAPFELKNLREANRMLQVFGGSALAGAKGMQQVGDLAAYAQRPVDEIARLYGRLFQSLSSGSSDPEVVQTLRQMGVFSGTAATELTKLVRVNADGTKVWDAFQRAIKGTSGQMQVMMKTYAGQTSNLADASGLLIQEMGAPFFQAAKAGLMAVIEWINGPDGQQSKAQLLALGEQFGEFAKVAGPRLFAEASQGIVKLIDFVSSEKGQAAIQAGVEIVGWLGKGVLAAMAFSRVMALPIGPLIQGAASVLTFGKTLMTLGATMETVSVFFPAIATGIEILTGPIGWVIGACVLLWAAWKNNWGNIQGFTVGIVSQLIHWYGEHQRQFEILGKGVTRIWETISWAAGNAWKGIQFVLTLAWENVKDIIQNGTTVVLTILDVFVDVFSGDWGKLWNDLSRVLSNAISGMQQRFLGFASTILGGISSMTHGLAQLPGGLGDSFTAASVGIDLMKSKVEGMAAASKAAERGIATESDRSAARRILGLGGVEAAHRKATKAASETPKLPGGSTALDLTGGGKPTKKGGKGAKGTDPNESLKSQIADLTKELFLNGDASKTAALSYDLFHGSLKGANGSLKAEALALQKRAESMATVASANTSLKSKSEEFTKTLALGVNATKEATLRYDLLHGEHVKAAPDVYRHTLALGLQALALESAGERHKKYADAVESSRDKIRGLRSEFDAVGISVFGTAKEWDGFDASQKRAIVSMSQGATMLEAMKQQLSDVRDRVRELRGEKAEDVVFGNMVAKAKQWLATAPSVTKEQQSAIRAVRSYIAELTIANFAMGEIAENSRLSKVADAIGDASQSILTSIDKLKKGDTATIGDRWATFWDSQTAKISEFNKLKPNLNEMFKFMGEIGRSGQQLLGAEDDAKYLKNFEKGLSEVRKEQDRVTKSFSAWVPQTREALVSTIEFTDGIRNMTREQAEQIAKSQESLDRRAKQIEQIKAIGQKVADYVGGLFDDVVHGKIEGLFSHATQAFSRMLQDMAAEYLKSQVTKGIMGVFSKLAAPKAAAATPWVLGGANPLDGFFAEGGNMKRGGTYMTGEKGPELVTDAASGFVVSNDRLRSMQQAANTLDKASRRIASQGGASTQSGASGGPVNVTMHIHTPDVAGFQKSRRQILADTFAQGSAASKRAG